MAAAPNACTTRKVRASASRPRNGNTSTPDRAANVEPTIQALVRTRTGLVACMASKSGSSTTARMAIPDRLQRNKA